MLRGGHRVSSRSKERARWETRDALDAELPGLELGLADAGRLCPGVEDVGLARHVPARAYPLDLVEEAAHAEGRGSQRRVLRGVRAKAEGGRTKVPSP